jgi:hypothetical protein
MHVPLSGGTPITQGFIKAGCISYDYQYHMEFPVRKGYAYTDECTLVDKDGNEAPRMAGYADLSQLRSEDLAKPKIVVVRDPCSWYCEYWDRRASTISKKPFEAWAAEVTAEAEHGNSLYHACLGRYIDDKTIVCRLEQIREDMVRVFTSLGEPLNAVMELPEPGSVCCCALGEQLQKVRAIDQAFLQELYASC